MAGDVLLHQSQTSHHSNQTNPCRDLSRLTTDNVCCVSRYNSDALTPVVSPPTDRRHTDRTSGWTTPHRTDRGIRHVSCPVADTASQPAQSSHIKLRHQIYSSGSSTHTGYVWCIRPSERIIFHWRFVFEVFFILFLTLYLLYCIVGAHNSVCLIHIFY